MDKDRVIKFVTKMLHDILAFIYENNDDDDISEKTIRTLVYIDNNGDRRTYKVRRLN